MTSVIIKTRKV